MGRLSRGVPLVCPRWIPALPMLQREWSDKSHLSHIRASRLVSLDSSWNLKFRKTKCPEDPASIIRSLRETFSLTLKTHKPKKCSIFLSDVCVSACKLLLLVTYIKNIVANECERPKCIQFIKIILQPPLYTQLSRK